MKFFVFFFVFLIIDIQLSLQDCDALKKKFEEMCKMNGTEKDTSIQKAKDCYPSLLPPDGDPVRFQITKYIFLVLN